jgi:hypothetical protein
MLHTHRRLEPKPSIDWTAEFAKLRGRAVASVYPLWENLKKQQIWSSGALPGVLAAMMVIGGIEFVRRSHHPAAAQVGMATTLEEVQQQTPQPSVLEVASYKQLAEDESDATPPAVSSSNSTPSGTTSATGNPGSTSDADLAASDAAAAAKPPSIDSAANGKRQVNMNYVLIQSYGDEKNCGGGAGLSDRRGRSLHDRARCTPLAQGSLPGDRPAGIHAGARVGIYGLQIADRRSERKVRTGENELSRLFADGDQVGSDGVG